MAVDYTPSDWLAGIDVTDLTYCKIPWAVLGDSSANEADIRKILRGMAESIRVHYLDPTPDDIPTKFTSSKSTKYNDSTLEFEERHGWTFDLTVDSTSLASETA